MVSDSDKRNKWKSQLRHLIRDAVEVAMKLDVEFWGCSFSSEDEYETERERIASHLTTELETELDEVAERLEIRGMRVV